jgi:metal iron transporter
MNCPVRTDPSPDEGHNQNPSCLAPELTTRRSLNTKRSQNDIRIDLVDGSHSVPEEEPKQAAVDEQPVPTKTEAKIGEIETRAKTSEAGQGPRSEEEQGRRKWRLSSVRSRNLGLFGTSTNGSGDDSGRFGRVGRAFAKARNAVVKFGRFVGPGFMVAVAYIDPGEYRNIHNCSVLF